MRRGKMLQEVPYRTQGCGEDDEIVESQGEGVNHK
jgi:hypothetical protein